MRTVFMTILIVLGYSYCSAQWKTNGMDIYYDEGNVGIMEPSPEEALHIKGRLRLDFTYEGNGGGRMHLNRPSVDYEAFISFDTDSQYDWLIGTDNDAFDPFDLNFWHDPHSHVMTLSKSNNHVGIGTQNPLSRLHITGGDIYIEDIDRGIIMKDPTGQCWRGTLNEFGQLHFTTISCPQSAVSIETVNPKKFQVEISPNPAHNYCKVSLSDADYPMKLEIFDLNGIKLYTVNEFYQEMTISLKNFSSGTYVLKITNNQIKTSYTEKLIILK